MAKTKQDRIKTVYGGGGHVVILGAGASIASTFRNPEPNGKRLPSMDNFIDIVELSDIVEILPERLRAKNFEQLYTNLHNENPNSDEIIEIQNRVYNYFKDMKLPENEATIYDFLVLSLRPRDLIATFNWDPFLYQAFCRNAPIADMPYVCFLHGSVSIGYSKEDGRSGPVGMQMRRDGGLFEPTQLLYPVSQKNYTADEFINMEWSKVKKWLHEDSTKRVTIFGYGAPDTDVEAVSLMNTAWGTADKRNMEQFEIIDIRSEEEGVKRWESFIHSHHYDYTNNYFSSSLASNPRRTFESYFQHNMPETPSDAFSASNPITADIKTLQELWEWHKPLVEAENEWKEEQKKKNGK
ncbi:hypothetical protein [Dyadobacter arcticus]|uniref:SIR2-like domain-containing protein n=1 Tax=Dyadobacter arcticus TaxID=1078754 RepID=A0ABX0UHS9_9BACT|nr:hypothetical protein [Dyadobacter arcticus]NIJ52579.1 hypothetical protein [Dyadobacter arcticus]